MKKLFSLILISIVLISKGQTEPKPLLPRVINYFPTTRDLCINSINTEYYFTAQSHLGDISIIMRMERKDGDWKEPKVVSFSGQYKDLEAFLSPNGLKLFFVSDRPVHPDSTKAKDFDIWYVERISEKDPWSDPKNLKSVNTEHGEFYPSIASNGNLYYTSNRPGTKGKDDIFYCKWQDNSFGTSMLLSDSINTPGYEYNAFIAPDESYIIFGSYNRPEGFGSGDLYISYNNNGHWSLAKNMGNTINSDQMDYCPFVDTKGQLYFTSKRSNLSDQSSKISSPMQFLKLIESDNNGQSKIYHTPLPKSEN